MTTTTGPLAGVRVLDLSVLISGPLAGMMLADQGADVIKVESPGIGDFMRYLGSSKGGMTGIFLNNNRGKRSLVVDLKKSEGIELLKKLVATADVGYESLEGMMMSTDGKWIAGVAHAGSTRPKDAPQYKPNGMLVLYSLIGGKLTKADRKSVV